MISIVCECVIVCVYRYMVKERYSIFQLIPDRDKLNTGSQGFHF